MACIDELERVVTLTDITVDRFLTQLVDDPLRHTYDLHTSLPGHSIASNPVLDEGWCSLPWRPSAEQVRAAMEHRATC